MNIVAIYNDTRKENACEIQNVLTEYGNHITTRLGVHNPEEENKGVIIVTYIGHEVETLVETLNGIDGVEASYM